jgi:hypothetical protein
MAAAAYCETKRIIKQPATGSKQPTCGNRDIYGLPLIVAGSYNARSL